VRFPGARDKTTIYAVPVIENLRPYCEDERGVYIVNTKTGQMEWAEISRTGRIIQDINTAILQLAEASAILFELTSERKYAAFSFAIIDTYLTGVKYSNEPIDLALGHQQTIIGLTSFEVIHERSIAIAARTYAHIDEYIMTHHSLSQSNLITALKKWVNVIIKNGVPFNNWNLFTATLVLEVASVLADDNAYDDRSGYQWFLNKILNVSSPRQWSFVDMIHRGFDSKTGFWGESPMYSLQMANNSSSLCNFIDEVFGVDIPDKLPIVMKSLRALPQYLFPNGFTTAYGDSVYQPLPTWGIVTIIKYLRRHGKLDEERDFRSLLGAIEASSPVNRIRGGIESTMTVHAKKNLPRTSSIASYVTPTFFAETASYFVQRNGFDPLNGLMIVEYGSKGNHMHANGIGMELYGKGLVMGLCSGIGTSYFQPDYLEYYSQFPAHNTVVVDGVSTYGAMRANHPLELQSCFPPLCDAADSFRQVTYSDIYFREPETNSDQSRLMSIIRLDSCNGYYVDIFRSRRRDGRDIKHEYFYQNLGQSLLFFDRNDSPMKLDPTSDLAFSDGDLFAYDYLSDKRCVNYQDDFKAIFSFETDGGKIAMNVWMKGNRERTIYSAMAPRSTALDGDILLSAKMVPPGIAAQRIPKLIVRQCGEAWTRPFIAIYEPAIGNSKAIKKIESFSPADAPKDFVGLVVDASPDARQYIFSLVDEPMALVAYNDKEFIGTYAVVSESGGQMQYLFLGRGLYLKMGHYEVRLLSEREGYVSLLIEEGSSHFGSSHAVALTLPAEAVVGRDLILATGSEEISVQGEVLCDRGKGRLRFKLPAVSHAFVRNLRRIHSGTMT